MVDELALIIGAVMAKLKGNSNGTLGGLLDKCSEISSQTGPVLLHWRVDS